MYIIFIDLINTQLTLSNEHSIFTYKQIKYRMMIIHSSMKGEK